MSIDSQIYQCYDKIEQYKDLRRKLENVSSYLVTSYNNCNYLKTSISNCYQVNDGESIVRNRTLNLSSDIESTYSKINNVVIPAINSAINSISNDISNLRVQKAREEAEKIK